MENKKFCIAKEKNSHFLRKEFITAKSDQGVKENKFDGNNTARRRAIFESSFELRNSVGFGFNMKKLQKKKSYCSSISVKGNMKSMNFHFGDLTEQDHNNLEKYISKKPKSFIFN